MKKNKATRVFIGYFALGLVEKKLTPTVSLGTLFFAALFSDLAAATFNNGNLSLITFPPYASL